MTRIFRDDQNRIAGFVTLAATAVAAATLAACTAGADGSPATMTSSKTPASSASAAPVPVSPSPAVPSPAEQTADGTPVTLEIEGRGINGHLDGSATSRSLVAQLPLTLTFRDFGGQEKVTELPAPLSLDGAPDRSGADPLTIGYYSPDQRLILYYDHVGSFAGIVPIGTFEDLDAVRNHDGEFTVTIRPAD